MFADFFVLILDLALAHTLMALTHFNSTEKLHRLYSGQILRYRISKYRAPKSPDD